MLTYEGRDTPEVYPPDAGFKFPSVFVERLRVASCAELSGIAERLALGAYHDPAKAIAQARAELEAWELGLPLSLADLKAP